MAKRASTKPAAKQARPSTAPLSPSAALATEKTPPEGFGVLPPAVPSLSVVIEHSVETPIVIPPAVVIDHAQQERWARQLADLEAGIPKERETPSPVVLDATHPAIALAQTHKTGAGSVPKKPAGRYVLPAPPEIVKSV